MQIDLDLGLGPAEAPEPAPKAAVPDRVRPEPPARQAPEAAVRPMPGRERRKRLAELFARSLSGGGAGDRILRRVRDRRPEIEEVRFTQNRRVMVSLSSSRKVLRLHACFADAPEDVVEALARHYGRSSALARREALRTIRRFLRSALAGRSEAAHGPRARLHRASDAPLVARLAAEFDRVNDEFFDGALPRVPLFLSGRMVRRNGHFSTRPLEIVISRTLCTDAEPGEAENTLRHEMIHLWQHTTGTRLGHGLEFRRWARVLGVHPRARRPVVWKPERTR
jgi:hypothetical protein